MRLRLILFSTLCLFAPMGASGDSTVQLPPVDDVAIRSDRAWEDSDPGVMHFSGHFSLSATDWIVAADSATLYGNLDDPETVSLRGKPASFRLRSGSGEQAETIAGDAGQITYLRQLKVVRLEQDARLYWGDNVIRGEKIEYDLDTDRIQAGGAGGVSLRFPPIE
jgi:lipopolysaccharide transport protein LptA